MCDTACLAGTVESVKLSNRRPVLVARQEEKKKKRKRKKRREENRKRREKNRARSKGTKGNIIPEKEGERKEKGGKRKGKRPAKEMMIERTNSGKYRQKFQRKTGIKEGRARGGGRVEGCHASYLQLAKALCGCHEPRYCASRCTRTRTRTHTHTHTHTHARARARAHTHTDVWHIHAHTCSHAISNSHVTYISK